ncbi:MAG: AMP-binding protein [Halodesulfovibrio sp.]|uniref:AMP-binding protein n=1 Tax=Halodesulfovibrio sp. TaxID=1912772 RepID=UPI00359D69DE
MQPILSINDVCKVILSICHSAVQEQTSIPLRKLATDTSRSVASILEGTPVLPQLIAVHAATMFQCVALSESLSADDSIAHWANVIYDAWSKHPATITFITSGSTGNPTPQKLETALLWQEAQELQRTLLCERKRIVSTVPCHHVYGFLFTILLPNIAELPCVTPVPFPSRAFIRGLEAGDFVVSFPLFWNGLIKQDLPFSADIHGSTSTAPCSPKTMHNLLSLGIARISNIYGSSETGGLGYQHHPDSPLSLFAFWRRIRCDDIENSWIERVHPLNITQTAVAIPDHIEWLSPELFSVKGRKDKIVQVGGMNVSLLKTAECITNHPDVLDCAVRLMRLDEGNRLKAFVLPRSSEPDTAALRAELYQLCRAHLRPAERPKKITFGTQFPVNAMGKAKDWD